MEGKARFIFPAILSCVMAFMMTAVITYLTRRAYRDEWLYEPAVSLYPERTWSELDD